MMNNELEVDSIIDYLGVIKKYFKSIKKMAWCYRGQTNIKWDLKPKGGREEISLSIYRVNGQLGN